MAVNVTEQDKAAAFDIHGIPSRQWPEHFARHREQAERDTLLTTLTATKHALDAAVREAVERVKAAGERESEPGKAADAMWAECDTIASELSAPADEPCPDSKPAEAVDVAAVLTTLDEFVHGVLKLTGTPPSAAEGLDELSGAIRQARYDAEMRALAEKYRCRICFGERFDAEFDLIKQRHGKGGGDAS